MPRTHIAKKRPSRCHEIGCMFSHRSGARVVRSRSLRRGPEPLSSRAGIAKAAEKMHQRMAVARKGGYFALVLWREFRNELGQFRVRQAGVSMMYAMIRLMEQSESHEPAERSL